MLDCSLILLEQSVVPCYCANGLFSLYDCNDRVSQKVVERPACSFLIIHVISKDPSLEELPKCGIAKSRRMLKGDEKKGTFDILYAMAETKGMKRSKKKENQKSSRVESETGKGI